MRKIKEKRVIYCRNDHGFATIQIWTKVTRSAFWCAELKGEWRRSFENMLHSEYHNRLRGVQRNVLTSHAVLKGGAESVQRLRYGLNGTGFESPKGQIIFRFSKTSRQGLRPKNTSMRWVPGFCPRGKVAGHSSTSSANVKNEWNYTSVTPIRFYSVDRENFTFYLICIIRSQTKIMHYCIVYLTALWAAQTIG